jgi:dipeptide/tripeptide permease
MRISTQQLTLDEIQDFKGKYPKQLWYLFLIEMWERFCFYGMRGVLTIFMVDKLLGLSLSDRDANLEYGQYAAGLLGAGMSSPDVNATLMSKLQLYTDGYKQLAVYALIAGLVMIIVSPFIRRLMYEVE